MIIVFEAFGGVGKCQDARQSSENREVTITHAGTPYFTILYNVYRFFCELKELVTKVHSKDSPGTATANKRFKTRLEPVDKKEKGDPQLKDLERTEYVELDEVNIGNLFH